MLNCESGFTRLRIYPRLSKLTIQQSLNEWFQEYEQE